MPKFEVGDVIWVSVDYPMEELAGKEGKVTKTHPRIDRVEVAIPPYKGVFYFHEAELRKE